MLLPGYQEDSRRVRPACKPHDCFPCQTKQISHPIECLLLPHKRANLSSASDSSQTLNVDSSREDASRKRPCKRSHMNANREQAQKAKIDQHADARLLTRQGTNKNTQKGPGPGWNRWLNISRDTAAHAVVPCEHGEPVL
jgi:hypothetical protein